MAIDPDVTAEIEPILRRLDALEAREPTDLAARVADLEAQAKASQSTPELRRAYADFWLAFGESTANSTAEQEAITVSAIANLIRSLG